MALAGLTMSVRRAEVFGFLGPNGAGKTTAVKLLVGLTQPTAGEAWVLGAPMGDLKTRQRLGYLPELFRYQGWLTAHEVLALHCRLSRLPRARWGEEIELALQTVGLADRARDRVSGFLRRATITSNDVRTALAQPVDAIVDAVRRTLESTPPELAADISNSGIVLAGGGALLRGIDRRISVETGLPVHIADVPLECVVLGAGSSLEEGAVLQRTSKRRLPRRRRRSRRQP